MIFGSVCSGIEAASVAWNTLGWDAAFFSEIEPFPCAVLAHQYPEIPNFGDMTKFKEWPDAKITLLVGGTPCQSFSLAGLRAGLADPRGNLMLTFLAIADRYRPEWLVWENVPGVMSSGGGGRDFGSFLGGLAELGYGFAYRILDAQYFGVPQRRRRVFVVANLRDWRRAAAVLFERESLRGDTAPSRTAGESIAPTIKGGSGSRGYDNSAEAAAGLITHSLRGEGFDASEDGTGRGTPLIHCPEIVGQAMSAKWSKGTAGPAGDEHHNLLAVRTAQTGANGCGIAADVSHTLDGTQGQAIAFQSKASAHQSMNPGEVVPSLDVSKADGNSVMLRDMQVRRLTPRECERLQGFPDHHTAIPYRGKPAADGPRYKALGNSMAVPVMRWIGERIDFVNALE